MVGIYRAKVWRYNNRVASWMSTSPQVQGMSAPESGQIYNPCKEALARDIGLTIDDEPAIGLGSGSDKEPLPPHCSERCCAAARSSGSNLGA